MAPLRASDIANAGLWPTPSTNFWRGLLWTSFSPIFAKTGVFQQYRPETGGAWISPDNRRHRDHLLMGYAAVDEDRIRQAVARLGDGMAGRAGADD